MEGGRKGEKKNGEFFGDARSLGSVVPLDKATIEQKQEWSCGRDAHWGLGLRSCESHPRMVKYLRARRGGGSGGKLILMALSSFPSPKPVAPRGSVWGNQVVKFYKGNKNWCLEEKKLEKEPHPVKQVSPPTTYNCRNCHVRRKGKSALRLLLAVVHRAPLTRIS